MDVITSNTQLGATKQDVIAAIVQKELRFSAKLLPLITDVSMFAVKGAKSIKFPKLTSFTVTDRASGTAGAASALTSSVDSLDLDKAAYVSWLIDSQDEVQSMIEAQVELARRAASAHARYVDEQIIAVAEAVGVATATAAPTITKAVILEMRKTLVQFDGNLDQSAFVISPAQEAAVLAIDDFARADYYGSATIQSGSIGRLYGVPVMVHNGLADGQYFLLEKSGAALGFQAAPNMAQQPAIEYGTTAIRVAMDCLFGVTGLQIGEKAQVGKSPLIIKDANV